MKKAGERETDGQSQDAAAWFVALDREGAGREAQFADWLDADPTHQDAYARCEAAARLVKSLRNDERIAWAFDDAARAAGCPAERAAGATLRRWVRSPAVAWSAAGVCAAAAFFAFTLRSPEPPQAADAVVSMPAPRPAIDLGTSDPVAVLPGRIAVDARSIAVLPFTIAEGPGTDASTHSAASRLYGEIVGQLTATPGLYVISGEAVEPYREQEIPARDIAAQLGVRGILEGRIRAGEGQLQVTLRFTDAAREGVPARNAYLRPVAELADLRYDIVSGIVLALASSPSADNES